MCHDKPWLVVRCVKQQNMLLLEILLPPLRRIHQSILHLRIQALVYPMQYTASLLHTTKEPSAFRALCASCSACTGKASKQPIFEEAPVIPPFILLSLKHEKSDKQQTHHSCFKIYPQIHFLFCLPVISNGGPLIDLYESLYSKKLFELHLKIGFGKKET